MMMKKGPLFLLGSFLLLFLLIAILPAQADGNGAVEAVNGHTRMTVPLSVFDPSLEGDAVMRQLNYHMKKTADGTVSGEYDYSIEVFDVVDDVSGQVICFKTDGNRAWVGATVDESTDPTIVGLYSWWQVADNNSTGGIDQTTFLGFGSLQETFDYCDGPEPNFIFDIDQGNVLVQDLDG